MIKNDNRHLWIDNAKIIGIFLVILGHMYLKNKEIVAFIYSFHMPLFFFLSGLLYKKESIHLCFRKSVNRLLIPYIVFYFISYFWWLYFVFIRDPGGVYPDPSFQECIIKPFIGMLLGGPHAAGYSYFVNIALWFLVALFEMRLIMAFLLKIRNRFIQWMIIAVLSLFYILIRQNEWELYFSITNMLFLIPFFAIGYYIKGEVANLSERIKSPYMILFFILFLILTYLSSSCYYKIIPMQTFVNYGIGFIIAICGIMMFYFLSNTIKIRHPFVRFISNNTLTIMGTHILFNGTFSGAAKQLFSVDTAQMPISIALFIAFASMSCSLLVACFMNKYFPILIGKETKQLSSD